MPLPDNEKKRKPEGLDTPSISPPLPRDKYGRKASTLSVKTLDVYNPYDYRTGKLSDFQAWVHIVKCSFGTGVLTMPVGFKYAGLIPALVLGFFCGAVILYCLLLLIHACVHIAARERTPYVPFSDIMHYTFSHGFPMCKRMAKGMKKFTNIIICAYHFGLCTAYINYMTQTCLMLAGYGQSAEGYNWPTLIATLSLIPFISAINCVRNLKFLAPVSMIGNIFTLFSMIIIVYHIFTPADGKFLSNDWEYVSDVSTMPIYVGIILFAVEAFGVIIAVERDMATPEHFVGVFGVFNSAMIMVLSWYLFLGLVGYLRYGSTIKSAISMMIPNNHWTGIAMHAMLGLALFCSYPLHCFVAIDGMWFNYILAKLEKNQLFWEYVFRCTLVVLSSIFSVLIPKLDLLVSLIGIVCLSFLGFMVPGIMDYNVTWSKYGTQWSLKMISDILIVVLGIVAFVTGMYGVLREIIT